MRLLQVEADGEFSLVEHVGEDFPRYAILSHRWGADDEEVTLQDLVEGRGKTKAGYHKIRFCGKQAARDGLQLFWVDTCCIDKSSSAELSEAINSMWRWYRNSEVCYAYLDDVPANTDFAASKWFTRGWTLQELLAPSNVVLFNTAWELIGTKDELADKISMITRIDKYYLGTDASRIESASIAERMCWASARKTKREEDIAYCLLGIFDISMPLLYGEGTRAFRRLQEEITKQSDDQSIFAWGGLLSPGSAALFDFGVTLRDLFSGRSGELLAQSPADFRACGDIVRSVNPRPVKPYAITNKGLQIEIPLLERLDGIWAGLNCRFGDDFFADLAIPLRKGDSDYQYQRARGGIRRITIAEWRRATVQSIHISTAPTNFAPRSDPEDNSSLIRDLPSGYVLSQVFPPDSWSPATRAIKGNLPQGSSQDPSNRRLVLVTSLSTTHQFAFVIFHRRHPLFRDWISEACILPNPIGKDIDVAWLYSHWKSRDLSILPGARKSAFGTILIRAAPQVVRGKSFTVIDIIVDEDRSYMVLVVVERINLFFRFTTYRLAWVLEPKRKIFPTYLVVYYFVIILLSFGPRLWPIKNHTDDLQYLFSPISVLLSLLPLIWRP